jgi:hypothetical protein
MDRLATSEPGSNPEGIVLTFPTSPCEARKSMFGVGACCRQVLYPSFFNGQSAMPSPTNTIYFIVHSPIKRDLYITFSVPEK